MAQPMETIPFASMLQVKKDVNKSAAQVNSILKTVLERCKKERDSNRLFVPIEDYQERVCYYTAYPRTYLLHNLIQEKQSQNSLERHNMNLADRVALMKCLMEFYSKRKPFIYQHLYQILKNTSPFFNDMTEDEFAIKLHSMGFEYKKTLYCGFIILENPQIRYEQAMYLNKIRKLRNTPVTIYYIDERAFFKNNYVAGPSPDNILNLHSAHSEHILHYMISRNGYEHSIFLHYLLSKEDYKKWIRDIIVTHLKPASAIIFKSSTFHKEVFQSNNIGPYHSKNDMIKWLQDHNIPCNDKMLKAELYELIKKYPLPFAYEIEAILKAHGHEVIRLPESLHQLSPAECLWEISKDKLFKTGSPWRAQLHLMNSIQTFMETLPTHCWSDFEDRIIKQENELFDLVTDMEEVLDNFNIDLESNVSQQSFFCHYCLEKTGPSLVT